MLSNYNFCIKKLNEFQSKDETDDLKPPKLITGKDLIQLGLKPGPLFKEILVKVEDIQLEGRISTKQEALNYIGKNYLNK